MHVGGFMPFYCAMLSEIRTEMQLELGNEASLQHIVISTADYNNPSVFELLEESEFSYKGERYDFKSKTEANGNVIFVGLKDTKENELLALLEKVYDNGNDKSKNKSPFDGLLKDMVKHYTNNSSIPCNTLLPVSICNLYPLSYGIALDGYSSKFSAPPDVS